MTLPFFYSEEIGTDAKQFVLNEEASKHIVQVLRMKPGEEVGIADGKGNLFTAEIIEGNKKKCEVEIRTTSFKPAPLRKITIAISLVKNVHRFEWFLEKAAEIGVNEIIPLVCSRTEKQHFRIERMKSILISAMLQSQQAWLTTIHEPVKYAQFIKSDNGSGAVQKFIAHCEKDEQRIQLSAFRPFSNPIILIGPEGDFTIDEIELALENNFTPVALGSTRLRTETAGLVAGTIMSNE